MNRECETNFMSFEDLNKLIEEHKKETHPYKEYLFDSISYTLLLIDISKLQQKYDKQLDNWNKLKSFIKTEIPEDVFINSEWFVSILDKMIELEQGGRVKLQNGTTTNMD